MRPHQLQLGFLKLLRGTELFDKREEYALVCSENAPYEVLKTKWLSFDELELLHRISDRVEEYVNSQGFRRSLPLAERLFSDAFSLFEELAAFYQVHGYDQIRISAQKRYTVFSDFIRARANISGEQEAQILEMIRFDQALHIHPARHMILEDTFCLDGRTVRIRFDHRNCSPVNKEAHFSLVGEPETA